jgi:uncharacterized membrane protein YcaP (DUF421 family)
MWIVIRVVFIYLFLLFAMRGLGKREFAQLSAQEVILLLVISETLQQAMVGNDFSMAAALIAAATLMLCSFLTSVVSYRFRRIGDALEGDPAVLVHKGKLLRRNMDLERVAADEIFAEMRRAGIERLEDVKWALLESDGKISVISVTPGGQNPPDDRGAAG